MIPPRHIAAAGALRVLGMGSALPGPPVGTDQLIDWVEQRFGLALRRRARVVAAKLGIHTRHICRDFDEAIEPPRAGQRNADLAARAMQQALEQAGLRPAGLHYLIGHTASPSTVLPSNVAHVARLLGYDGPFAEFRQACTGFVNAVLFARGLIAAGSGPVGIVGSETGSVHFDPRRAVAETGQLVNMMQMGDGAAAIVLAADTPGPGARLSHVYHGQDGTGRPFGLSMAGGGSDSPGTPLGFTEFSHDFAAIRESGPALLQMGHAASGVAAADWYLPHQANGAMGHHLCRLLGVPPERVVVHADRVGNTGSAAIWLALAAHRPAMKPGETTLVLGAEATAHMFGGFVYTHG